MPSYPCDQDTYHPSRLVHFCLIRVFLTHGGFLPSLFVRKPARASSRGQVKSCSTSLTFPTEVWRANICCKGGGVTQADDGNRAEQIAADLSAYQARLRSTRIRRLLCRHRRYRRVPRYAPETFREYSVACGVKDDGEIMQRSRFRTCDSIVYTGDAKAEEAGMRGRQRRCRKRFFAGRAAETGTGTRLSRFPSPIFEVQTRCDGIRLPGYSMCSRFPHIDRVLARTMTGH